MGKMAEISYCDECPDQLFGKCHFYPDPRNIEMEEGEDFPEWCPLEEAEVK